VRNAGQRAFFFLGITNAIHFPPTHEERGWRDRHRVHVDRLADRDRGIVAMGNVGAKVNGVLSNVASVMS
jgi:hypothetical protein